MKNITNEAKKELLSINPHALQGLHNMLGYDLQKPYNIAHIRGAFTLNSIAKAANATRRSSTIAALVKQFGLSEMALITIEYDPLVPRANIEHKGGYKWGLDYFFTKRSFEDTRKSNAAEAFVIVQDTKYIRKPQEKPFDAFARYDYIIGKDSKCSDGHGKTWIDRITVKCRDGSGETCEVTKRGEKYRFSRIVYRSQEETLPQSHLEIIDKSGYLLPERRANLLRRADLLRKERAKAAYQAIDNTEKVKELRAMVEQKKREFSEAIMTAANSEELRKAAHELYFKFMWAMSEYERFADKTARRDYVSIHAAENAYNHIKEELGKVVC